MNKDDKIQWLLRQLVVACKEKNCSGFGKVVDIDNDGEYYVRFNFRDYGNPPTEGGHLKVLSEEFGGSVRDYLLSFRNVEIKTKD